MVTTTPNPESIQFYSRMNQESMNWSKRLENMTEDKSLEKLPTGWNGSALFGLGRNVSSIVRNAMFTIQNYYLNSESLDYQDPQVLGQAKDEHARFVRKHFGVKFGRPTPRELRDGLEIPVKATTDLLVIQTGALVNAQGETLEHTPGGLNVQAGTIQTALFGRTDSQIAESASDVFLAVPSRPIGAFGTYGSFEENQYMAFISNCVGIIMAHAYAGPGIESIRVQQTALSICDLEDGRLMRAHILETTGVNQITKLDLMRLAGIFKRNYSTPATASDNSKVMQEVFKAKGDIPSAAKSFMHNEFPELVGSIEVPAAKQMLPRVWNRSDEEPEEGENNYAPPSGPSNGNPSAPIASVSRRDRRR